MKTSREGATVRSYPGTGERWEMVSSGAVFGDLDKRNMFMVISFVSNEERQKEIWLIISNLLNCSNELVCKTKLASLQNEQLWCMDELCQIPGQSAKCQMLWMIDINYFLDIEF